MAILSKGQTFANADSVTSTKLNNLVDAATFVSGSSGTTDDSSLEVNVGGRLQIKDLGVNSAKLAASAVTSAKIDNGAVTTVKITNGSVTSEKLAQDAIIPAGAIMPFAMNSTPTGWLATDGTAVSRSTYANLFAAISTTYGVGDGSTTFNLPDLRGYFVRGSGTNVDGTVSGTFAAKQADAFQGHWHEVWGTAAQGASVGGADDIQNPGSLLSSTSIRTAVTDGTNGTPRVASETRPKNIAMLYCIKY